MNDHELDTLIAAAAPMTDAEVAGMVDQAELDGLARRIVAMPPADLDREPTVVLVDAASGQKESNAADRGRMRLMLVMAAVVTATIGLGVAAGLRGTDVGLSAAVGNDLITSEMILEDGVVTEAEYRAGAHAVISCLTAVGLDAEVDFDNANGHAAITGQGIWE